MPELPCWLSGAEAATNGFEGAHEQPLQLECVQTAQPGHFEHNSLVAAHSTPQPQNRQDPQPQPHESAEKELEQDLARWLSIEGNKVDLDGAACDGGGFHIPSQEPVAAAASPEIAATAAAAANTSWCSFIQVEGEGQGEQEEDCASCREVFSPEPDSCASPGLLDCSMLPDPEPDFDPYTAPDVRAAFQRSPELLEWVTGVPDSETAENFHFWAERLAAFATAVNGAPGTAAIAAVTQPDQTPSTERQPAEGHAGNVGPEIATCGMMDIDNDPTKPPATVTTSPDDGTAPAATATTGGGEESCDTDSRSRATGGGFCMQSSEAGGRDSTPGAAAPQAVALAAAAAPPPEERQVLEILSTLAEAPLNLRLCLLLGDPVRQLRECGNGAVAAAANRVAGAWQGVAAEAMGTAAAALQARLQDAGPQQQQHQHQHQQQGAEGPATSEADGMRLL